VKTKRPTEQQLLEGLDAHKAHADERFEPLPQELDPLERLKGSVLSYKHPLDSVWDEYVDLAPVSDGVISDPSQPSEDDFPERD